MGKRIGEEGGKKKPGLRATKRRKSEGLEIILERARGKGGK